MVCILEEAEVLEEEEDSEAQHVDSTSLYTHDTLDSDR